MTLVFVHGFLGCPADWARVANRFPTATCLCVPKVTDWEAAVQWLHAEVSRVEGRRTVVGYSMGGRLALGLALAHPDSLDGLVLVSASPGITDPGERKARAALDDSRARALRVDGLQSFVDHWYAAPFWSTLRDAPSWTEIRTRRLAGDAHVCASHVSALSPGRMPDLWPHLPTLNTPTLFVAGARDAKYVDITHRAAQALPDARVHQMDAGHSVHLEAPEPLADGIAGFIKETQ